MTQVNMLEAKTDLSKLVRMLETKEEDVIYLARNGTAVAQMTLIPKSSCQKRIGAAEGKFKIPDEFDAWDKEIEEMFGGKHMHLFYRLIIRIRSIGIRLS